MCGIAAIVSSSDSHGDLAQIRRLIRSLEHRGDRNPKVASVGRSALGCARLAIVDQRGGAQPFVDISLQLAITFNGEIYNHNDLRTELLAKGVQFRSNSDTEVVLRGYAEWGTAILDRLEGMYAFVIVDERKSTFFAARDPFGIKPLYYLVSDNTWYFASEIYPLAANIQGAVECLAPGSLILNGELFERVRYPHLRPLPQSDMSLPTAITLTRQALAASVQRHLPPGDLKVAVFCSGGIDSSAILYEAVQACLAGGAEPRSKLFAYCVGVEDSEDQQFASDLARALGVPYRFEEIRVADMLASIPSAITTMETFEPNHIRAGTASLALARRVQRDNLKVALVGEGADELFGGYEEFSDAMRTGDITAVETLLAVFTSQLHRTQLRRVDRTTMAVALEARVPFLDKHFSDFVLTIPTQYKVYRRVDGTVVGKHVLREAYRGALPDHIVDRRKVPLGEGAGIGDNRAVGPFHDYCERIMDNHSFKALAAQFPEFALNTKEEAYYFQLFLQRFGRLVLASRRPRTNVARTT